MKKKSKKIDKYSPTKYLVLMKAYNEKQYDVFGFDTYKCATGFYKECVEHGCKGKIYEVIK